MVQVPQTLIAAARSGGAADVERLLQEVWPEVYRLAFAVLGRRESAEDAAQEACVAMFRNIASLRDAAAFNAWCYRIVVREALRERRRHAAAPLSLESSYAQDIAASFDLWQALDALSDALRTVVVLHYFEGLTSREIARILRVPDGTVRFRLMTARRRLARALTAESKGNVYAV